MQKFKNRWEIKSNWQLVYPILGIAGLLVSSVLLSTKFITGVLKLTKQSEYYTIALVIISIFLFIPLLGLILKIFKALEKRWNVTYRWELIAIFIVFAVTGSTSARISDPIISFLGIHKEYTSGWIYWPLRILIIFPVYQILLIIIGWIFGQFEFFWTFEKKMLRRLGFSRFLKK